MNDEASMTASLTEEQKEYREGLRHAQEPPESPLGILRYLGPGLIVAGSIVGSGELIATTKTGAEAGFWLLWLIAIGCVIKVFVQVEFGRYAISTGKTTMTALNEVPGPRIHGRGNWLVWYWFIMFLASLGQLGGIVGGVGQAMALSLPLTERGQAVNEYMDAKTRLPVKQAELQRIQYLFAHNLDKPELKLQMLDLQRQVREVEVDIQKLGPPPPKAYDAQIWAALIAVGTAGLLMVGRYGLIQFVSAALVAGFTAVTVANLIMLQENPVWRISFGDLLTGLKFQLPPSDNLNQALATALAAFGIIGVGASELVVYPYWCLEKGYARYTGPRNATRAWANRAQGWLRVMRWDVWLSMVIYTFATIAFYLLGASILGRTQLNPGKTDMVRTLSEMYVPVFGEMAQPLFLFGAFAVLYSTYFVANASHARTCSDALRILGFGAKTERGHWRLVTIFSGVFPLLCLVFFLLFSLVYEEDPAALVLISGVTQAIMLPMLAGAALYFRYHRVDRRIAPGNVWDFFLWTSAAGMLLVGVWTLWTHIAKLL